jgi:hypothetical protein
MKTVIRLCTLAAVQAALPQGVQAEHEVTRWR